jgi:NAD(P)-dependent dehydrogenase (short-subunit alcohol dehydrogenase family)
MCCPNTNLRTERLNIKSMWDIQAGVASYKPSVFDYTVDEWERMMHVNTTSCFLAVKYATPAMQITSTEKGKEDACGSIVMTASGASFVFVRIAALAFALAFATVARAEE